MVKPIVSDRVLYQPKPQGPPYAALVTAVNDDETVDLAVFPPVSGWQLITAHQGVAYSQRLQFGYWSWPPPRR